MKAKTASEQLRLVMKWAREKMQPAETIDEAEKLEITSILSNRNG